MNNGTRHPSLHSRFLGAWWGLFIGDALGLPSDGYYKTEKIAADYGDFSRYSAPKEPHPHSEIHRIPADTMTGAADCLHHRREKWSLPGTHYHSGMKAGDNTLSAVLAIELARCLGDRVEFDRDRWLDSYRRVLLTPDGHRDFYIPAAHRTFVTNLAKGLPPEKCGEQDSHIAALVEAAPILLLRANDADALVRELGRQIGMVRPDPALIRAGTLLGEILRNVLAGMSLEDACFKKLGHHHHPYLTFPYHRWIGHHTDEEIATHTLSQGPASDDAVPLALFIALKYSGDFEKALAVNARLGGDTCHRGSLVGMLLGAMHGCEDIPVRFVEGLVNRDAIDATGDLLWNGINATRLAKAG